MIGVFKKNIILRKQAMVGAADRVFIYVMNNGIKINVERFYGTAAKNGQKGERSESGATLTRSEHYYDSTYNQVPRHGVAYFVQSLVGIFVTLPLSVCIGLIFHVFYEAAYNIRLVPLVVMSGLNNLITYDQNLVVTAAVLSITAAAAMSLPWYKVLASESYLNAVRLIEIDRRKLHDIFYEWMFVESLKLSRDRSPTFTRYAMHVPLIIISWNALVYLGYIIDFFYLELQYRPNMFTDLFLWLPKILFLSGSPMFIVLLASTVAVPVILYPANLYLYRYAKKVLTPLYRTYVNFVLDRKFYSEKSRRLYTKPMSIWVFLYESYRFMTRVFWFAVLPTWVLANSAYYFYHAATARRYENKYRLEFKHMKEDIYALWDYFLECTKGIDKLWALTLFVVFVLFWPAFIHAPLPRFWDKDNPEPWTVGEVSSRFIKGVFGVIFDWNTNTTYLMLWVGVFIGGMYERARVFGKYVWKDSYAFVEKEFYDQAEGGENRPWKTAGEEDEFGVAAEVASPHMGDRFVDPYSYNNIFHWTLEDLYYENYSVTFLLLLLVPFSCFLIAFFIYWLQREVGTWTVFWNRQRRRLIVFTKYWRQHYKPCLRDALFRPQSIFLTYIPMSLVWLFAKTAVDPNRIYKGGSGFGEMNYGLITGYFRWTPRPIPRRELERFTEHKMWLANEYPSFSPQVGYLDRTIENEIMEIAIVSFRRITGRYRVSGTNGFECPDWLLWAWEPVSAYMMGPHVPILFLMALMIVSPLIIAFLVEMICPGSTGFDFNWYREYRLWTMRGRYLVLEVRRRAWWEEKLKLVERDSFSPDKSKTWLQWIEGYWAAWITYITGVEAYKDHIFVPRIRRTMKWVLAFVLFLWPQWCWMHVEKFIRLTFEGYWATLNSKTFMLGSALFFAAALFGLMFCAKEYFFRESTGIEPELYDDEVFYRSADRRHWTSKKRMVYYDIPLKEKKFEGSLRSLSGIFYIFSRLFWGMLWSLISVWLPISMGVPVGTGLVFRPDVIYNLIHVPEITWNALCYMWFEEPNINRFVGVVIVGQTWSAFLYYNNKTFDEIINPRGQDRVISLMDATAVVLMAYVASIWSVHCGYVLEEAHTVVDDELFYDMYLGDQRHDEDYPNDDEERLELHDVYDYEALGGDKGIVEDALDFDDDEEEGWEFLGGPSVYFFDEWISRYVSDEILTDQILVKKYPKIKIGPWWEPEVPRLYEDDEIRLKQIDDDIEKHGEQTAETLDLNFDLGKGRIEMGHIYVPDIGDVPVEPRLWEFYHPNETGDGYVDKWIGHDLRAPANLSRELEDHFWKKILYGELYKADPKNFVVGHPVLEKAVDVNRWLMSWRGVNDFEIGELIWDEVDFENQLIEEDEGWDEQEVFERFDELYRLEHRLGRSETEEDMLKRSVEAEHLEAFWFIEEDEYPYKWGYNPNSELSMITDKAIKQMVDEAEEYLDEQIPMWEDEEDEWEDEEIEADEDLEDEDELLPEHMDEIDWDWDPKGGQDYAYYKLNKKYGRWTLHEFFIIDDMEDSIEEDINTKIDY